MSEKPRTKEELDALSVKLARQEEALIQEYKRTHKLPSRGVIITPEIQALREEQKALYSEYCKLNDQP